MAIVSLEIQDPRIPQPKCPKSLAYVVVGLLIGISSLAIGFLFMGVGREYKLYAPVRDRVGQLTSSALALHSASLSALKQKISNSDSSNATATAITAPVKDRDDRIAENFPITQMQLPSLYNLILSPLGEEAFQLGVPSRQTLLYDLSVLNRTSEMNWEWRKSPPPPRQDQKAKREQGNTDYAPSNTQTEENQKEESGGGTDSEDANSGRRKGRKVRSGDD